MTGRHAATERTAQRSRASALFGARMRARAGDLAVAVCGAGLAFGGTELGGPTGAGMAIAGVGVPSAWLAWGAGRTRRKLDDELVIRRRSTTNAAAQDSRIQALRQRLRSIDAAQTQGRGELAVAQSGLLATRVELAAMRSQLAATRHDLAFARHELVQMREQLTTMLATRVDVDDAETLPELLLSLPGSAAEARAPHHTHGTKLILPAGLVMPGRSDAFTESDRLVFDAFAETDLDDLTGIISVGSVAAHARATQQGAADTDDTAQLQDVESSAA